MPQHVFHDICLHIVWHTKNDEPLLKGALERAVHEFLRRLIAHNPSWHRTRLSQELCERWGWRGPGDSYFQFITTPAIGPTNNAAERALRSVFMDRHVTPGTRSGKGRQANERLWTVIATCSL